jgi:hypothetical protein
MNKFDRCLKQIQAVRKVADREEPAYVARSRIGRLSTSVAHLAAKIAGVTPPPVPRWIEVPEHGSPDVTKIITCSNRLFALSRHVGQPSEPLERRWRAAWSELLQELSELEVHLRSLQSTETTA